MLALQRAALACFAAAAAWPAVFGSVTTLWISPLERAMRESACGAAYHASSEWLGHCAACWGGSAALVAVGSWLLMVARRRQRPIAISN